MLAVLLFVCAAVSSVQSAATGKWAPPLFCHTIQCPEFSITENHTEYEKRHYKPTVWVSTSFNNVKFDSSINSAMFFKLFHFIDGGNSRGMKIAMTAPVLVEMVLLPGDKVNATMNFMVPLEYQSNPPTPTDSTVFITRKMAMDVYVISYGGFSSTSIKNTELSMLKHDLIVDHASTRYDRTRYFTAGYDGPFSFTNRHNEVWLLATS